jgi:hypothetical protein
VLNIVWKKREKIPQKNIKKKEKKEVKICGSSKIKLKKVNKKRTVTLGRVIIFLNISRHPLLI